MDRLTDFQKGILEECRKKQSGTLSVPMGSGKTLVSLVLAFESTTEPILIVVPNSILGVWITELDKFYPQKRVFVLHGSNPDFGMYKEVPTDGIDVYLTTSDVLRSSYAKYGLEGWLIIRDNHTNYFERPIRPFLSGRRVVGGSFVYTRKWEFLIVDEAHRFTNYTSAVCRSIASISAHRRWLLSGTLFDNPKIERIFGYYLMLDAENVPRNIPEFFHFMRRRFSGISSSMVHRVHNESFVMHPVQFHIIEHALSPEEEKIFSSFQTIYSDIEDEILQLTKQKRLITDMNHIDYTTLVADLKRTKMTKMGIITSLRQFIVSPLIPLASAFISLLAFNSETRNSVGNRIAQTIQKLELDEWMNNEENLWSSRMKEIRRVLESLQGRSVVFFCYRSCLDLFKQVYARKDIFVLTSSMTPKARTHVLEKFQHSENGVLLLTYAIGSEGLNLQFACNVLLVNYFWNYGSNAQAIARVLRYGQKNPVQVFHFTSNTGMEQILLKKQIEKLAVVEQLMVKPPEIKVSPLSFKDAVRLNVRDEQRFIEDMLSYQKSHTSGKLLKAEELVNKQDE